jgi:hypothetical protein
MLDKHQQLDMSEVGSGVKKHGPLDIPEVGSDIRHSHTLGEGCQVHRIIKYPVWTGLTCLEFYISVPKMV